jgi:hypothetical protein
MLHIILENHYGFIGAVIGCVLGVAGGGIGTYFSIKNAIGPRQRKFMIKAAVFSWISLAVFLGLLLGLPFPYGFIMWVPYGIFLPIGITYLNKRLYQLQMEDGFTKTVG